MAAEVFLFTASYLLSQSSQEGFTSRSFHKEFIIGCNGAFNFFGVYDSGKSLYLQIRGKKGKDGGKPHSLLVFINLGLYFSDVIGTLKRREVKSTRISNK